MLLLLVVAVVVLFLIRMSNIWIYVMSRVRPADRLAWQKL